MKTDQFPRERAVRVAIYGAGQLGKAVYEILAQRACIDVVGVYGRGERDKASTSRAEVVIITTTSFLRDVAPDMRSAIESGANVITSAEEAIYPWAIDPVQADELDEMARSKGVTILGCGLNPGFVYDALVATASGATAEVRAIAVERVAKLSGFGEGVLRRIGIDASEEEFESGVASGMITGHIGFSQSMHVTARALGQRLDRVDGRITPIFGDREFRGRHLVVAAGRSVGFRQEYVGVSRGKPWFEARFTGHMEPMALGQPERDEIWIYGDSPVHMTVSPGFNPQRTSAALVANSVLRVRAAQPGWLTVADLPPATPTVLRCDDSGEPEGEAA